MALEFGSPEAQAILKENKELAYEKRREVTATVICKCGKEVELEAETDEWIEADDGTWEHSGFGPASGECDCGRIYVETFEGIFLLTPKGDRRVVK